MLFDNRLFRKEALAHKGQTEPLNHLLRVTAPHEWVIVWGLAVIIVCTAIWSVFGSIEQRISADCILTLPGNRHAIVATDAGVVADILVRPGDWIESEQTIAIVRSRELVGRERTARTELALLEGLPENALASKGSEIELARAELLISQALLAAGESIASGQAGQVVSLSYAPGQAITEGATIAWVRSGDERNLEALTFVSSGWAQAIEPGAAAHVEILAPQYRDIVLNAEVSMVSHRPKNVPRWLLESNLKPLAPNNYPIRAVLEEMQEFSVTDGMDCRVWFTRPPVSLFRLLMPNDVTNSG